MRCSISEMRCVSWSWKVNRIRLYRVVDILLVNATCTQMNSCFPFGLPLSCMSFCSSSLQAHRISIFSSPSLFSIECHIARKFAHDDWRATIDQPHLHQAATPASSRLFLPSQTSRFPLDSWGLTKTLAPRSRTSIGMQTASVQSIH